MFGPFIPNDSSTCLDLRVCNGTGSYLSDAFDTLRKRAPTNNAPPTIALFREVAGDGVIGQQPILNAVASAVGENVPAAGNPGDASPAEESDDQGIFEYESCTALAMTPGEDVHEG